MSHGHAITKSKSKLQRFSPHRMAEKGPIKRMNQGRGGRRGKRG